MQNIVRWVKMMFTRAGWTTDAASRVLFTSKRRTRDGFAMCPPLWKCVPSSWCVYTYKKQLSTIAKGLCPEYKLKHTNSERELDSINNKVIVGRWVCIINVQHWAQCAAYVGTLHQNQITACATARSFASLISLSGFFSKNQILINE